MTRNELEQLEHRKWDEKTPLLDEIYVIVDRKKHDSGYRYLNIYGVAYGDKFKVKIYCKQLSNSSDVIHLRFDIKNIELFNNKYGYSPISIDSLECNVTRYFVRDDRYKFKVGFALNDFDLTLVEI